MKVCVITGSPKGQSSITYQTVRFLEKKFPEDEFSVFHAGARIHGLEKDMSEAVNALSAAELILFCYPVYTFIAPYQLHRFIELVKESGVDLRGKYAAQITTSKHFYDVTALAYVKENCFDMGMKYAGHLSADMEDLLKEQGRKDAVAFWSLVHFRIGTGTCEEAPEGWAEAHQYSLNSGYVSIADAGNAEANAANACACQPEAEQTTANAKADAANASNAAASQPEAEQTSANAKADAANASNAAAGQPEAEQTSANEAVNANAALASTEKSPGNEAVIVTNALPEDKELRQMIADFVSVYPHKTDVVELLEFPFRGGCLGCLSCAASGKCIYNDGFDDFLRNKIQAHKVIIYAFRIKDHSMGASMKIYDDRQFCNGHRTVTMGAPIGYIVAGNLDSENNLKMIIEGRSQVGGNFLAGIARDARGIKALADTLVYALDTGLTQPANFYGVGGSKIFRDLIWVMRGMMKLDHQFYKSHGFYDDMPQKQMGTRIKMSLVGALISNPKMKAKMNGKISEGMQAPYEKVLNEIK